jgi:hypothetical protein
MAASRQSIELGKIATLGRLIRIKTFPSMGMFQSKQDYAASMKENSHYGTLCPGNGISQRADDCLSAWRRRGGLDVAAASGAVE